MNHIAFLETEIWVEKKYILTGFEKEITERNKQSNELNELR